MSLLRDLAMIAANLMIAVGVVGLLGFGIAGFAVMVFG